MADFVTLIGTGLRYAGYAALPFLFLPACILFGRLENNSDKSWGRFVVAAALTLSLAIALHSIAFVEPTEDLIFAIFQTNAAAIISIAPVLISATALVIVFVTSLTLGNHITEFGAALLRILDRLSGIAMGVAAFAAFAIIMIQLSAVLLRYVFGLSFSWLNDSVVFSFAMIFMLGAAATLRDDGHVRVDIMRPRFSASNRATIELAGALLFIFPIGLLILTAGSDMIARTWTGLEPFNESDGLPIKYLFKTLVPMFAVLIMAQGLSQALKAALALRGLRDFDAPEHEHGGAV